jgi:hypothetical protein
MTNSMRCQDKERLIDYLYGEDAGQERTAFEAHLAVCEECSGEIAELRVVRERLAEWRTPEIDLGFRVVRDTPGGPARSRVWVPAWAALPAAAVLVLAVGAAVANIELQYDANGVTVRTGWARAPEQGAPPAAERTQAAAPVRASDGMSDEAWRSALVDLERRLRAEFTRTSAGGTPAPAAPDRGQLVAQMRTLIEESERRQQRELALRLAQVVQDVDSQRSADLVQIEQNIGHIEGLTAAQRDMMQYLVRVSEGR